MTVRRRRPPPYARRDDRRRGRQPRPARERTADSRLLILDAAVACLVEDGYAGASTLAVQARAGVSRGRLLHHFPSRAELLVAAAEHLSTTLLAEVRRGPRRSWPTSRPAGSGSTARST